MMPTVAAIPPLRSSSFRSASSRWAKSRRSSTIFLLDAPQALSRTVYQAVEIVEQVGQVDLFGDVADLPQQLMLVELQGGLGLLIEQDDLVEAGDLALQDGDVVGDGRERVVDLVGDAGRRLDEAGHLRLLEHPALSLLELVVGDF
jgi:hypothetical protein